MAGNGGKGSDGISKFLENYLLYTYFALIIIPLLGFATNLIDLGISITIVGIFIALIALITGIISLVWYGRRLDWNLREKEAWDWWATLVLTIVATLGGLILAFFPCPCPTVTIHISPKQAEPGQLVYLRADLQPEQRALYSWAVSRGYIESDWRESNIITYKVPDHLVLGEIYITSKIKDIKCSKEILSYTAKIIITDEEYSETEYRLKYAEELGTPKAIAMVILPTSTPTPTPTSTPTTTPTPTCPYQASTDADTIMRLINAEAEAVRTRDISIIQNIFAQDATIRDEARGEQWQDPVARYTKLFTDVQFTELTHFDIQPVGSGIRNDVAYFTSGSKGKFHTTDDPMTLHEFTNESDSDHWKLRKDEHGCWAIAEFSFNASHVPFPPP